MDKMTLDLVKKLISDINKAFLDNAGYLASKVDTNNFVKMVEDMDNDLWEYITNQESWLKEMYLWTLKHHKYAQSLSIVEYAFANSVSKSQKETV